MTWAPSFFGAAHAPRPAIAYAPGAPAIWRRHMDGWRSRRTLRKWPLRRAAPGGHGRMPYYEEMHHALIFQYFHGDDSFASADSERPAGRSARAVFSF